MPHTSSRRRQVKDQLHPTKLSHEIDDDGWSHVVRKSSAPTYLKSHAQSPHSANTTRPNDVVDFTEQLTSAQMEFLQANVPRHALKSTEIRPRAAIYTLKELQKRFGQVQLAWKRDTIGQRLGAVLGRVRVGPDADKERIDKEEYHKDELVSKDANEPPMHAEVSVDHAVDVTKQLDDLVLEAENSRATPEKSTVKAYPGLDKAICIGLGSPSADNSAWEKNVLWQLVAFLEMAKILSTQAQLVDDYPIKLYIQDPVLNDVDLSFLSSLDIQVMPSPKAFSLIDSHTVVYAPHYQVRGWPAQMRQGHARCIIGNDVKSVFTDDWMVDKARKRKWFENLLEANEQTTARTVSMIPDLDAVDELRDFVKTHEAVRLPTPEGDVARSAFNDTFVYWKPDQGGK